MARTWLQRSWKRELPVFSITVGVAGLSCILIWHLWQLGHPVAYDWDGLLVAGVAKSCADRGLSSLWGAPNPWLGAPSPAVWADFPTEDLPFLGIGLLSNLVGTVLAMNLAFFFAVTFAAASMYLVCRRLRIARPLAMAAALLLSLSPYLHYRNVGHLLVALYWHVPLWFLVWSWASSRRGLKLNERRFWFSVGVAVLTAAMNNYFLNFLMQVLLLVVVLHLLQRRWRQALATGGVMVAGMTVFALSNFDTWLYASKRGFNTQAVARNPGETLLYALRPLELFWPWNLHRIDLFAKWGSIYAHTAPVTGEFPSNYLGVIPAICFVALVLSGFGAAWWGGRRGSNTRFTVFVVWLTFVAMGGGLMQLSQMITGFVAFRSNNRVSIVLMALALAFAGRALTTWSQRLKARRAWLPWAVVTPIALLGVWEQSPDLDKRSADVGGQRPTGFNYWQMRERWAQEAASDQKMTAALEAALPDGAAVLQVPSYPFPEAGPVGGFGDYEPFRLYLHSHQKLRYSYGNMKGRPEAEWESRLLTQPVPEVLKQLRAGGFGAVVFDARQVGRQSIEDFQRQAEAEGPTQLLRADAGDWVAVILARPR